MYRLSKWRTERRVILGTTAIECEHGYDHCPICDALPTPDDVVEALNRLSEESK